MIAFEIIFTYPKESGNLLGRVQGHRICFWAISKKMTATFDKMADLEWQLLPACTSLNGRNRSAPIVFENQSVKITLEPTKAPFNAGNFNAEEIVRLNLDLSCTASYTTFLNSVDKWALRELGKNPTLYFKKDLTPTELKAAYRPCATPHEKNGIQYPETMRVKIMVDGPNKIRCWTPDRQPRPMPEDWRKCTLTPQIIAKSIWLMNGQAGVLFECQDCIIEDDDVSCPF